MHRSPVERVDKGNSTVEKLTAECLKTPYDKEFLACINSGSAEAPCFRAFQVRHGVDPTSRREKEPD